MAEVDMAAFDPNLMKKKKKKKVMLDDEPDAATEASAEGAAPSAAADDDADLLFKGKKKKQKKPKALAEDAADGATGDAAPAAGADLLDAQGDWADFSYDELLERVYGIMREKNPEMATGEKKKFVMKPPSVMRVGSKKTAFANFADICRLMKRNPKHVLQFLLAELGTSGSVDANQFLILKGRFQQKHFESVLRKYIKEYVSCHTCKGTDTLLQKDTRLFFLQCETCGSRCSVTTVKTGFTAVVTKRARIRAAAGQ